MANLRLYMESVSGESSGKTAFSVRGAGKSSRTYFIGQAGPNSGEAPIESISDLYDAVKEILGTTERDRAGAGLKRNRPLGDPVWQHLYAESINNIAGIGRGTTTASDPFGILEAPTMDRYWLQPGYKFDVTFTPRPYAVLSDERIPSGIVNYYDVNGDSTPYVYASEWLRYVDVETIPAGEYITAQAGQFIFDVNSGLKPDAVPAGSGQLKMFVRKKMVKMTWYEVPYIFVEGVNNSVFGDSYRDTWIMQGLGCVNQYDWWKYPKGTLLLDGVGVNRYTRFLPDPELTNGATLGFSNEKMCDITFLMSYTNPPLGKDSANNPAAPRTPDGQLPGPLYGDAGPVQTVQAGHNLVPYAHSFGWFYVRTKNTAYRQMNNRPLYPSFPFELLFSKPLNELASQAW